MADPADVTTGFLQTVYDEQSAGQVSTAALQVALDDIGDTFEVSITTAYIQVLRSVRSKETPLLCGISVGVDPLGDDISGSITDPDA
jgi:hypothetical protein